MNGKSLWKSICRLRRDTAKTVLMMIRLVRIIFDRPKRGLHFETNTFMAKFHVINVFWDSDGLWWSARRFPREINRGYIFCFNGFSVKSIEILKYVFACSTDIRLCKIYNNFYVAAYNNDKFGRFVFDGSRIFRPQTRDVPIFQSLRYTSSYET